MPAYFDLIIDLPMLIHSQPNGTHDNLDFAAVKGIYTDGPQLHKLTGTHVTSPFHLFAVETLRDQHNLRVGPAIPTDVFVWAIGEPARREVTKIGGLPYWPADKPWPQQDNGDPCRFLAQITFSDSRDLVPDLPGEILLVFANDPEKWAWASGEGLTLVWQDIHAGSLIDHSSLAELMADADEAETQRQLTMRQTIHNNYQSRFEAAKLAPRSFDENAERRHIERERTFCCYGVLYRTFDYPEAFRARKPVGIKEAYRLPVIEGSKISGARFEMQDSEPLPGQLLCQLASVQAAPTVPYPWVNSEQALTLGFGDDSIHSQSWMIGDMGCLYFSIDNGSIYVNGESY